MTHVKFSRKPFEANLNSLVDDMFSELPELFRNGKTHGVHVPANIKESDNSYSLEVVAPGFEKSDFKISLEKDILTISGERKEEATTQKHIRKEYAIRPFKRSFTLDEKIDAAGIEAAYVNGVLTLNLPKKEIVQPASKDIKIQ